MWEALKNVQANIYGADNEVLVFTIKNIGTCYLGLALPEKAEVAYLEAVRLLELEIKNYALYKD